LFGRDQQGLVPVVSLSVRQDRAFYYPAPLAAIAAAALIQAGVLQCGPDELIRKNG
jgi:hypothetical protein